MKNLKTYTRDDILTIAENMVTYGGSFIRAIGESLYRADAENIKKLQATFPEEFETYLNIPRSND